MVGEPPHVRPVAIDDIDLGVAVARRREAKPRAVGRPGRQPVFTWALGDLFQSALVDVRDEDVGRPAPVRRVGDGPTVGRPRGIDVQRALGRHAPLVLAVVVGDVDLFDAAVFDRATHALAVAIRVEGQLRARHAAQRPLCLVNFVGDRVRVHAGLAAGPVVVACECGLSRSLRVEEPHFDMNARRRLLTVPMTTPSAFSSRQRSNGTSSTDFAAGIVA